MSVASAIPSARLGISLTGLGALLANLLALVLPLITIQLFDRVIPNEAVSTLVVLAAVFLAAAVMELLLRFAVSALRFGQGMTYETTMQEQLIDSLLRGRPENASPHNQGLYLDAFDTVEAVRQYRTGRNTVSAFDVPFAILFLGVLAMIDPVIAGILLIVVLLAVGASYFGRSNLENLEQQRRDHVSRSNSFMYEALSGAEHLKGLGAESFMARRFESLTSYGAMTMQELQISRSARRAVVDSIVQCTPFLMAACGALFVIQGDMTAGELAAAILLSGRVVRPFTQAIQQSETRRALAPAEARLQEALSLDQLQEGTVDVGRINKVELRNVTVHDTAGKVILRDVNLLLKTGDAIAIEGANGSGKSVFLKLIAGQVAATQGEVLINEIPIRQINAQRLGDTLGFLQQQSIKGSIGIVDMITGCRGQDRLSTALSVAKELGLMEFLSTRSTSFAESPNAQIATALPSSVRAQLPMVAELAKSPSLVLFDEANATLDFEADQALLAALAKRKQNTMMVMVTQRPSYAKICDRHFVVQDGQLIEKSVRGRR